ncbi:MAG: MMPL family transporter, partial [Williamsia herbipolensis]|nr:MMPL family transporter [Williamsia herbipolensis]
MASLLFRVGRFCYRHRWSVIATWVLALVVLASLVGVLKPTFAKDFSLPGTDSGTATSQVEKYFPEVQKQQMQASTSVLVAAPDGLANHTAQIDKLVADLKGLPELTNPQTIVNPVVAARADPAVATQVLGDNGRVGLIQVRQGIEVTDLKVSDKEKLTSILSENRGGGLDVEATGSLMQAQEPPGKAEAIGFAVAFVVMIVAFGALVASFIPLITGLVGVGLTIMLVTLGAEFLSINQTATAIVT